MSLSNKLKKIARTMVLLNLNVKERESVIISAGPNSLDFAEELAFVATKIGAHSTVTYGTDKLALRAYKTIKTKYLKHYSELSELITKKVDVEIYLDDSNPFLERKFPQKKIEIRRKATKPLRELRDERIVKKNIKSALVGFPTKESARSMNIPFNKLNKIFWDTMDVNYNSLHETNRIYHHKLFGKDKVRIIGKETNLEFSIKNRKPNLDSGLWVKGEGGYLNLPAGEVFLAPVETSVNGEIYFDLPNSHYGMQIKGIWFKFKDGKLIDYSVDKGLEAFENVYKNASGDKNRIGELGIGTNPKARLTGGMIIVDEKVLGTIHMAIGHNKHFGGKNDATIHWDFFKEMRKDSSFEVDNKIVLYNGKLAP
jgi:aminopeptidase